MTWRKAIVYLLCVLAIFAIARFYMLPTALG